MNDNILLSDEVSEVKEWAERMIKSGHYPDTTGRFRIQALTSLMEVMQPEEPRSAQHILDDLDSLVGRWARQNHMAGDTPKTYKSRAHGLLKDFIRWRANPSGFKVERKETAPPKKVAQKNPSSAAGGDAPNGNDVWEAIKLEGGRVFRFHVDDITMKDAARIAYALAARATDFDPKDFVFSRAGNGGTSSSGSELSKR